MSEEEDDTPPEALFFMKRAEFVPKVTFEDFKSVSKLLDENVENKLKFTEEKKKVPPGRRCKTKKALKPIVPLDKDLLEDGKESSPSSPGASPLVRIAPSVKRRLKKLQTQRANELKTIEAANQEILSAADSCVYNEVEEVLDDSSESFANCILTVSYMSDVSRLRCFENEKFSTIFPKIADLFKLKASEILLCLRDKNIKVEDTPKSLNITLDDTIECIPYKGGGYSAAADVDKMKIYFQSDDKKEKISLLVHKLEKMQEVMKRYSEHQAIALESLRFEFDGEKIEGTETPEDLDMESGNCIDVKILVKIVTPKKRRGRRPRKKWTPKKKKSPPLTVVCIGDDDDDIVDVNSNDSEILSD